MRSDGVFTVEIIVHHYDCGNKFGFYYGIKIRAISRSNEEKVYFGAAANSVDISSQANTRPTVII